MRSIIAMKCDYAIFCDKYTVDSSNHVTIENMFSSLTLDGPGTSQFHYVLGVSGVPEGEVVNIDVVVRRPDDGVLTAKWETRKSTGIDTVQNGFFNCSQISLEAEGTYTFTARIAGDPERVISSRSLKVLFK